MQTCQIWGDMSADRVDDQYPTVTVCDACAEAHSQGENAAILHVVGGYEKITASSATFVALRGMKSRSKEKDGKDDRN